MAKESNKLDKFFSEKLSSHEEKPSALAWERLESRLPQKSKSYKGIWWAAAASFLILFTVSYFLLSENGTNEKQILIAENSPIESNEQETQTIEPATSTTSDTDQKTENQTIIEEQPTKTPTSTFTKKSQQTSTDQIKTSTSIEKSTAQQDQKEVPVEITIPKISPQEITPAEVKPPFISELDLSKTVAEEVKTEQVEEPAYKVTIYSDGIKEGSKDKNLIADLGKKVEKVEGFIGKVDQGFADLQDAKNNLFISLLSKKEKDSE